MVVSLKGGQEAEPDLELFCKVGSNWWWGLSSLFHCLEGTSGRGVGRAKMPIYSTYVLMYLWTHTCANHADVCVNREETQR